MKNKEKRYCPVCGERVRHSTRRCPFCQQRMLSTGQILIYVLIAVVVVSAIFLVLDYLNIELFK